MVETLGQQRIDDNLVVDTMLGLLEERPYEEVTVRAIADHAGLSLANLYAHYPTRGHILDAFVRRIDREVLERDVSDMADESPRERLFDVLMARFDALRPYRGAIHALGEAVRRDPALAFGLNAMALRSQSWMMAAAGIEPAGWRGRLAVQGLAISFAKVLRVFVREEDPGLPRTMAALDKELQAGERTYQRFARVFGEGISARPPVSGEAFGMSGTADNDVGYATDPTAMDATDDKSFDEPSEDSKPTFAGPPAPAKSNGDTAAGA